MNIVTTRYVRKPLYVQAIRVTKDNFHEVAAWCQGEIQADEPKLQHYIHLRVHHPLNVRQSRAYIGDWILYTEAGYKIYTNKAFFSAFKPATCEYPTGLQDKDDPKTPTFNEETGEFLNPEDLVQGEDMEQLEPIPEPDGDGEVSSE